MFVVNHWRNCQFVGVGIQQDVWFYSRMHIFSGCVDVGSNKWCCARATFARAALSQLGIEV